MTTHTATIATSTYPARAICSCGWQSTKSGVNPVWAELKAHSVDAWRTVNENAYNR